MILRVFRGSVRTGHEGQLAQLVRDRAIADVLKIPGFQSWQSREPAAGVDLSDRR